MKNSECRNYSVGSAFTRKMNISQLVRTSVKKY